MLAADLRGEHPVSRHRSAAPVRDEHQTDRTCTHCGLVRRTRHEPGVFPWIEWLMNGGRLYGKRTPPCVRVEPVE